MEQTPIENEEIIEIDKMSIDQFAGAVVLILGAVGSLLLVIWQSRCACRCRIGCSDKCYLFDCTREPPNQQEINELEEEREEINNTLNKKEDKEEDKKEEEIEKII
jgi:hypothetical protein